VAASDVRALSQPLPECYRTWLFYGRNYERGDDPFEALRRAQQAFDEYRAELGRLDIDDIDLGHLQGRIDSATALVGADDSPASFLRTYVENATSQHSALIWADRVLRLPCALVDANVHFPDGTKVRLHAESAGIDFVTGRFKGFDYVIDEDSIIEPDGSDPDSEPR
jgi:hypothetical protein